MPYCMPTGVYRGKLLGNAPSAVLVERIGQKATMTTGMVLIGTSFCGIAMSGAFDQIVVCRGLTGLGVAAFATGATMYLTELSTPLNRATTLAPPTAAFSAGMVVGPAVGGALSHQLGLQATFGCVGVAFGVLGAVSQLYLPVSSHLVPPGRVGVITTGAGGGAGTTDADRADARSDVGSIARSDAGGGSGSILSVWGRLLRDPRIRNITALSGAYQFVYAGTQMTVLPLMLVGSTFALDPSTIGAIFAGTSVVSVLSTPVAARVLDRVGYLNAIFPASAAVGVAMTMVPFATESDSLAPFLSLVAAWTVAGAVLSGGPTAYISSIASPADRNQVSPQKDPFISARGAAGVLDISLLRCSYF